MNTKEQAIKLCTKVDELIELKKVNSLLQCLTIPKSMYGC